VTPRRGKLFGVSFSLDEPAGFFRDFILGKGQGQVSGKMMNGA
jgi:hypothetical protein